MLAIFLDIETTGLDPFVHRPLEIAMQIFDVDSGEKKGEFQSIIYQDLSIWEGRDRSSIEVNGFTLEMLQSGRPLHEVRESVERLFLETGVKRGGAVFICQNPAFDRGFFAHVVPVYRQEELLWPYHWLDLASMYWSRRAFEKQPFPTEMQLSKNAIAKEFGISPESHPHRALNGVLHLVECYRAVLGISP